MKLDITHVALAAIFVFFLGFAFYAQSELSALHQQVNTLQQKPESLSVLINGLDRRVGVLEQKQGTGPSTATAKLFAFYDSTCALCSNEAFLKAVDLVKPSLEKQGISLQLLDVKTSAQTAQSLGVKTVPTFYASSADLAVNPKLVDFLNQLIPLQYGFSDVSGGVVAQPPTVQSVFASASCATNATVRLEEFYSPTCAYCVRMSYANGTAYNPVNRSGFEELAEDAFKNVTQTFGSKLDSSSYCISVHAASENQQAVGLNQSDDQLCTNQVGADAFNTAQIKSDQYGLIGAPSFVVDCKYVTKVHSTDTLNKALCDLRPDLCAKSG